MCSSNLFGQNEFFWDLVGSEKQDINHCVSVYTVLPPASALLGRVSALEDELRQKAETLKSIQSEMVQSKKDLAAKELSVQRTQNELSLAQARVAKESERVKSQTNFAAATTTENNLHIGLCILWDPNFRN